MENSKIVSSVKNRLDILSSLKEKIKCNGFFVSFRKENFSLNLKKDNNIFFIGLIFRVLKKSESSISVEEYKIVQEIESLCRPILEQYKHRKGDPTFNFYSTRPDRPFPNNRWMKKLDAFYLPDDSDTTAVIGTAFESYCEIEKTKNYAEDFYFRKSDDLHDGCVLTYFSDKMPIVIDLVVQANWQIFMLEKKLPIERLVSDYLSNKKWFDFSVSRKYSAHYPSSIVILYSICLIEKYKRNYFSNAVQNNLIEALNKVVKLKKGKLVEAEKVLMGLSYLYLESVVPTSVGFNIIKLEKVREEAFSFFVAPLSLANTWLYRIEGVSKLLTINYWCPSFNEILYFEYSVLWTKSQ